MAESIVILTGAGISKESGLDTFRDADGIWSRVRIEDVATPQAFRDNPLRVHDFYNARRQQLLESNIQPNPAHLALARLQRDWPGEVLLVTQNIDDLHERGGSASVLHMHGELLKARCTHCHVVAEWRAPLSVGTACPSCGHAAGLRPHVVWFGEMPLEMERIYTALDACGLFVSIGTSGNVYPAAGFVDEVSRRGHAHTVELNLEPSSGTDLFDEAIHGPASEIAPAFVERVLTSGW
ncbi:Sir2 family NAD+-dependent deacetylase [Oceanibaculum indicum]|uniref:NAD-dependent protein deacylase n=1 Tax=Oceanibaculum indicum P24 TaxID=1207063 RepID=K2J2C0_9PROT|nr:Sir2 family NAD+-dependent deacetylase [Oceanibaculum indicum]EKE69183.1 NAD-dependent deacetylase [Oceanibaculum indicum P24]